MTLVGQAIRGLRASEDTNRESGCDAIVNGAMLAKSAPEHRVSGAIPRPTAAICARIWGRGAVLDYVDKLRATRTANSTAWWSATSVRAPTAATR